MKITPDAFMDFADKYNGKELTGKIRWFDGISGEGMVRLDDGTDLYCHFTAIVGIDKNNYQWPNGVDIKTLEQIGGMKVKVVPYITPGYVGCDRVEIID